MGIREGPNLGGGREEIETWVQVAMPKSFLKLSSQTFCCQHKI